MPGGLQPRRHPRTTPLRARHDARPDSPPHGGERDRFVDLVRACSILAVVVGHWLVTQLSWTDGRLVLTSSLGAAPQLWPVTWVLQVIPLFFFVGGFVDLRAWHARARRDDGYCAFLDRRVDRLLRPVVVYLGAVAALSAVLTLTRDSSHGGAGPLLLQPIWFLGVYVVVVALTPLTLAWHQRSGWLAVLALAVGVAAVDWARLGLGLGFLGYLNVIFAWVLVHQLGYFYAEGRLTQPRAVALTVVGGTAAALLVWLGPYPARMVGVPGDALVNMNPPTAALTALAIGQIGLTVLLRGPISRALRVSWVWSGVVAVNLSIMTIYLWHQAVYSALARVALPLGLPQPPPASATWWASRAAWFALGGTLLAAVTALLARFEHSPAPAPAPRTRASTAAAVVAITMLAPGLLGLAGTDPTSMLRVSRVLGSLDVAPVLGIVLVAVGVVVLRAARRGAAPARHAMLAGAAVLALLGLLYGLGVGSLAPSTRLVALCLGCAAVPLMGALAAKEPASK